MRMRSPMVSTHASFGDLRRAVIEQARTELIPRISGNEKLVGREKLIAPFEEQVAGWKTNEDFGQILETINEIAAAIVILDSTEDIVELAYEPRLAQTKQTIDFRITFASGNRCWIDVKTVAPRWMDDDPSWQRFERIANDFPGNARLVVDRQWAGAAISGQEIKARWTLIRRTQQSEAKEALLTPGEKAPVRLLFCSNGALRKDALEDFADFYRTGQYRPDDWARNAVARYLADENITFSRTLAGFSYLRFRWEEGRIEGFEIDVRGLQLPGMKN